MTEQEKIDLRREGYMQSLKDFSYRGIGEREFYAKQAYPDPPKPREITASNGVVYRMEDGVLLYRACQSRDLWHPASHQPDDIRAIYDLLERPNE